MKKSYKTVGLYEEGKKMPRIEYRILKGEKDITEEVDIFEKLIQLLKSI